MLPIGAVDVSRQAPSARHAVGIDLGTTNIVVAFAPIEAGGAAGAAARVFEVPQLVGAGEVATRALLPSSLYTPLEGERIEDPFGDAPWAIGAYARARGGEVAGRLVASSKSWLVHPSVDRTAAILPWGAGEDVPKLSPVDAAARVLGHVRRAWDDAHRDAPLAEQDVVLTVPASFDEVARELTLEAARRAGLEPRLLEEPQAAFYDWMARAGGAALSRERLVVVVDVGGGTTDLSLVRVAADGSVARVAVGPHVLLGGDNVDLALAHAVEPRLSGDEGTLDAARFAQLVAGCREAKEKLLGARPPEDAPVTVVSPGARLVGGTRTTRITREEAERIAIDGFFPVVPGDAKPQRSRGALVAFGLPYERDVAVTRHVASFLTRHLDPGTWPDSVLLNGGVFRADAIARRLVEVLGSWRPEALVERLVDADPDVAVARGAVAYALARRGHGTRIGGGSARGYFVAVDETLKRAVCVVPRGAEEGATHGVHGRTFALATGRRVRFDVLASDEARASAGDVVEVDEDRYVRLPPLVASLDAGAGEIPVTLEGELTPVGTLDLACVEAGTDHPRRFRLAFQVRGTESMPQAAPSTTKRPSVAPSRLDAARALVDRAFGKPRSDATGREAKDLLRELERALGERPQWDTQTNRALFDAIVPDARARRRSADHERVFWLLAGWCIRPGFGDPADASRVGALFALFDERLAFPGEARGWQQYFIAWRRAAGGLDEAAQTRIRDFVDPYLASAEAGLKRAKKGRPALSLDDARDTASALERIPPQRRSELGSWILERTWTDRDPRLWEALGRLGARVPAYASVHHVVAPLVAERWIDHLLRERWDAVPTATAAAVRMARRTGDRARDVSERVRREVEARLVAVGADRASLRAVREIVEPDERDRAAFFGDTLPPGLRLVG
jgi:molecular chaperone DnaK (HSP70)